MMPPLDKQSAPTIRDLYPHYTEDELADRNQFPIAIWLEEMVTAASRGNRCPSQQPLRPLADDAARREAGNH
jgi:hypothetical protein